MLEIGDCWSSASKAFEGFKSLFCILWAVNKDKTVWLIRLSETFVSRDSSYFYNFVSSGLAVLLECH